jgi:hypothetical protein
MFLDDITQTSGPNGSEDWLICGLDGAGWTPANVQVQDIVTKDLAEVLKQNNNPFSNCGAYVDTFYKYASQYNGMLPHRTLYMELGLTFS